MVILRHSRIAVTMEIYTEVPDQATRDALGKLSEWLDQADEPAPPRTAQGETKEPEEPTEEDGG